MYTRTIYFVLMIFIGTTSIVLSQENVAAKLGYPADSKLLIIHADDLGMSHSENIGSIEAIENGSVNSASVMMPTPWVLEAVDYAKANPDTHDFGLHLTLTSEWKNFRYGPVSSKDKVPSLIDEHGYFHEDCRTDLNLAEVETELKAQIDRAYSMGLEPTHLDMHMGCLAQTPELMKIYNKMGQLYNLPIFTTKSLPQQYRDIFDVKFMFDVWHMATPEVYAKGIDSYYVDVIENLKPGLSLLLLHAAYDNEEMKAMCIDHPDWGNEWRQKDFDFFTSKSCKELLEKENIKLVTYRQLKEVFYGEKTKR